MENTNIFFPIEGQVGSHVTHVTPGGSLRERLAAARQKPVVETTVDIAEEPAEIPMVENTEPEGRIIKRTMESKVFGGSVPVVFNRDKPDTVLVDGVKYQNAELKTLLAKGLSRDELTMAHETKRAFDGTIEEVI